MDDGGDQEVVMYPLGHVGLALLVSAPVAVFLKPKAATSFSVLVLVVALVPDVDTYVPGLTHHGITHTVTFALAVGVVGGALLAGGVAIYRRRSDAIVVQRLTSTRVFLLGGFGLFCGILSHVIGDLLIVLPGTEPIPVLWPLSNVRYEFKVIPLGAPLRNAALFVGGLAVHALISWRVKRKTGIGGSYADSD